MKRTLIITLLLLVAAFSFGQTNATFNNLDVRNTTKLRGLIYPFGAVATSPINTAVHEIAMINNTTFALCRMDFKEFADSIANYLNPIIGSHWERTGNYLYPITLSDSVGIGTSTPIERLDVQNGNINLDTTSATSGQITQNGETVLHTFKPSIIADGHNLFLGNSGNFTMSPVENYNSSYNIGIGDGSLVGITTGFSNIAVGYNALHTDTTGSYNTAIGYYALSNNSGDANIAIGHTALSSNTSGHNNTTLGVGSMQSNISGNYNTAIGYGSLSTSTGDYNTSLGAVAGSKAGNKNIALGYAALGNSSGSSNIALGYYAGFDETGNDKLYIENSQTDSAGALIFGNFATDKLTINGDLKVTGDLTYEYIHLVAYTSGGSYTPNTVSNVEFKLAPGFSTAENVGLTFAGDTVTIATPGDYMIQFSTVFQGANGDDWIFKVRKNGTAITSGNLALSTTGAGNYCTGSWFWYLHGLVAGDDISFSVTNEGANNDPTFRSLKIFIDKKPE